MKRLNLILLLAVTCLVVPALACEDATRATDDAAQPEETAAATSATAPASAEAPQASKPSSSQAPAPRPKFVPPVKGIAEIGYLKPVTKVVKDEVVTTIRVKNMTNGSIAGLRIDEFWWDAQDNPLPGDSQRLKKPLMPGEEATIELRVPKNPKMDRNNYNFSHANGEIKPKLLPKF